MEAHSHRKMTLKQNSGAQKKYEFLHLGNWCIKDTLKAFDNFKIIKKVYEVMIFDMQKYIYSIFYIQYILYYSGLFSALWIEVKNKY